MRQHYPAFTAQLAAQGSFLSSYVERELEAYLKCGRLEHGFLRALEAKMRAWIDEAP